jgi:hypothetical protein
VSKTAASTLFGVTASAGGTVLARSLAIIGSTKWAGRSPSKVAHDTCVLPLSSLLMSNLA